jgi:hypothetical protein
MTGGVEVTVETGGGTGSSDEVLVTTDVVDEALVSTGVVEEVLVSSDVVDEVLVSTGSADEDEVLVEVELGTTTSGSPIAELAGLSSDWPSLSIGRSSSLCAGGNRSVKKGF